MSDQFNDNPGDTVRLLRPPPRVFTETTGQNVWMGDIEPMELELESSVNTDPYNSADAVRRVWRRAATEADAP